MADDSAALKITIKTDDEQIVENPEVTGDKVLRKIGYVVKALDMGKSAHIRYTALNFMDYLDLRRTESKTDGCGLILFHDKDIEKLRFILTMKDTYGKRDDEVIEALTSSTDIPKVFPGASFELAQNNKDLMNLLGTYLTNTLLPEIYNKNQELLQETIEANARLTVALEEQREQMTKVQEEVSALREELQRKDEEQKRLLSAIEENTKKRRKFLGIF